MPQENQAEIVVPDALAATVLECIQQHAHTGNLGDGKIFVLPVEDAIRIRTGAHERLIRETSSSRRANGFGGYLTWMQSSKALRSGALALQH